MGAALKRRPRTREAAPEVVRVAIYTRKSVTEGLDQDFNSLDAQREAVEAFVASQRGAGWVALEERYDDGGFTGANTARPAFQRLLRDVEAGKVDAVAVYRTDRLSRSLLDFAKLMEFFQAQGVAFVSVTEAFDTSIPMGRMVLNMLATFAQFERETIAERTRDKVVASRRKGMWTGGRPVLGFDVVEKRLVVNEAEAERVRAIFELYLDLGSLLAVVEELGRREWTTKAWTNAKGQVVRGHKLNKSSIRHMLGNPLYAGKVRCGDEIVDGNHEAIVGQETFDAVQAQLERNNGHERRNGRRRSSSSILAGLVRCAVCGSAMSPHHTNRKGRRYCYLVCQKAQKEGAAACPGSRVPAGALEQSVVEHVRAIGRDPDLVAATIEAAKAQFEERKPDLEAEARGLDQERGRLSTERRNLVDAVAAGEGAEAPALLERLGEVEQALQEATERAEEARAELTALEAQVLDEADLRAALGSFDPVWSELFPRERARVLHLLIEQVEYDAAAGEVAITFRPGGVRTLAGEAEGASE